MPLLNGVLQLHDVHDVEKFARAILNSSLTVGAKTKNGYTGPTTMSAADFDECLTELITVAWDASRKFRTQDDGRGTNRFSGYLSMKLHWAITDWKRANYGSTRYNRPTIELTDDERILVAQAVDFTGPEVLDLIQSTELTDDTRRTLAAVVIPLIMGDQSIEDYAERSGKPLRQIHGEIRRAGEELEQKQLLVAA